MRVAGLEPAKTLNHWFLRPARYPIRHTRIMSAAGVEPAKVLNHLGLNQVSSPIGQALVNILETMISVIRVTELVKSKY